MHKLSLRHALRASALVATLAGCADVRVPTEAQRREARQPVAERETASRRWIALTRVVLGRREPGPLGTARTFALVSVAQHNAIIAAGGARERGLNPSEAGAAAGASAAVLRALYPADRADVESQMGADAAYFGSLPTERDGDFAAGVRVGEEVAAAVLAYAATDGSRTAWTGTIPVGPGFWRNAPPPAQPLAPLWGTVRPWSLARGDQFRPAPPPAFGSPEFLAALAEVRRFTDARTPAQLRIAQFWQGGSGPGGPMGHFGAAAGKLAEEHRLGERASARMYALLYTAMMDASIGCWDAKYAYWYIRPHQADPAITTPVGRPNFPAYPSAHSCLSAAAVGVLGTLFPSSARELHAQVEEAGVARLYAGLHFRFDVDAGRALGFEVARAVLEDAPRGNEPIALD